jgi:glycosyltransferase involved in cell wall biosynthesis
MHRDATTDVSIIICTRNRASFLRETLRSLRSVRVPADWQVELLIVDNGSTDDTGSVIHSADLAPFELQMLEEPTPGVSNAKNLALRHARGEVLLFTDDDVRFPPDWLVGMTEPIRSGVADAVAGAVVLAPHLRRPWQEEDPWLTTPLATTAVLDTDDPMRLVGANMSIRRSVFDVVPGFDPALGPGSERGLGEETLLTYQIRACGFRVTSAFDVVVEHHCAEERLTRASYLEAVEKIGRSQGYIDFHWRGAQIFRAQLVWQILSNYAKLLFGRHLMPVELPKEGLPGWEMSFLTQLHHQAELLRWKGMSRKYLYPHKCFSPNVLQGSHKGKAAGKTSGIDVSVIICTRNRAKILADTLRSLQSVQVPPGWRVELVVVDNGSTDRTADILDAYDSPDMDVRLVEEPQKGLSRARNRALRVSRGQALLFTDDDVRVPDNWIEEMTTPILRGDADAVAGGVELAPHLRRPWQNEDAWLATPLATTDVLDPADPERLVGANMAIGSQVFEVIGGFDTNLGAGSELGMGEETLLTHQIKHQGFRMISAFDVAVEHHCGVERLSRESYLQAVTQIGRSQGYIDYHWKRRKIRPVKLLTHICASYLQIIAGRSLLKGSIGPEALPGWEMARLSQIYHRRQLLQEWGRPRQYDQEGRTPVPSGSAVAEAGQRAHV